ncbi:hypothetical protein KL86APRO_10063 [uncultured Alphaproteobacteria bacterium]|uniref:Uncharacterized protein n=1 Tax=uncultured Alphaproteobacteria bacterium TaxID=91750 RepID=A0A212IUQ9_9PROT|nr:hypothetical protein KL86APRO_10063 [uncultured Alphaproteobacteria bacterium]
MTETPAGSGARARLRLRLARIAALPTPGSDPATGAPMAWEVAED